MRIIKIEMENLNSLKGKWSIDFTHPDYETFHNLFVISGDTGAGKTTILDAITLALYGKTPRQEKISKSENELMTCHTGYCMARVTYKCKKGIFVSEFYQNRANNRPTGALQAPVCSITNLEDGSINSEIPVTKLEEETVKIIQLDYDQFSRSMMLAQGQFDTFIKGNERERAAILAKLNGTEKYKEIGRRICDKASVCEAKFKEEKTKLDALKLLSEEEIEQFNAEIESKNRDNIRIKKDLDAIGDALVWYKEFKECQKEFDIADSARKDYENAQKEFQEKSANLSKAEKAEKCNVAYNDLETVIKNIAGKETENSKLSESLIKAEADYAEAEKSLNEKKDALKAAENQKAIDSEIWKKVRDYDSQIKPLKNNLNEAEKHKDSCQKKLDKENKAFETYKGNISELENEIKALTDYLNEHQKDKDLEKLTAVLEQKKDLIIKEIKIVKEADDDILENTKSAAGKREELTEAQKILDELKEQLKNLVSTEFVSISLLLRNQLEKGKACPVCGSINHPSCECGDNTAKQDEKSQKVAVDVAGLNKKLEAAEKKVSDAANLINSLEDEIKRLGNEKKEHEAALNSIVSDVNQHIKEWNFVLKADDAEKTENEFEKILLELSKLSSSYQNKEKEKTKKENELSANTERKNAIKIEELKTEASESEAAYNKAKTEYDNVNNQREALFGEKNPETEEKNAEANIAELKKNEEEADRSKNEQNSAREKIKNTIEKNQKEMAKLSVEKLEKQKIFENTLSKNGFASEKEFLDSRMSEADIENLKKNAEKLKTQDVKTRTALNSAVENLNAKKEKRCTDVSEEKLNEDKAGLEKEWTDNSERLGEIKDKLNQNETVSKQADKQKVIFEEAQKQKILWTEMKNFIGVKTGDDFEVFVETLAFKKLLKIATNYVEAITGKYSLVQVENKVDFLVHDSHYPDNKDDRPVSNMSGGEKFIISLSLALGISELASQNVKVESLFLDEGFGTLSGKFLIEAINALKSLQANGKMLGIITHIDTVINSFDLRIEAEKTLAGTSILKGPGVEKGNEG